MVLVRTFYCKNFWIFWICHVMIVGSRIVWKRKKLLSMIPKPTATTWPIKKLQNSFSKKFYPAQFSDFDFILLRKNMPIFHFSRLHTTYKPVSFWPSTIQVPYKKLLITRIVAMCSRLFRILDPWNPLTIA